MKNEITVTQSRGYILVNTRKETLQVQIDPEDVEKAKQIERLTIYKDHKGRKLARAGKENDQILLHRHLFDIPKGHKLEWVTEDTLDLRRKNLRLINKDGAQVPLEPEKPKPLPEAPPEPKGKHSVPPIKKSDVRGVYFHKASQRWHAAAFHEGKRYSLGYFQEESEAVAEVTLFRTYGPNCKELKRNQRGVN